MHMHLVKKNQFRKWILSLDFDKQYFDRMINTWQITNKLYVKYFTSKLSSRFVCKLMIGLLLWDWKSSGNNAPRLKTLFYPTIMGLQDFDSPCVILQPVRVPGNMFKGYDFLV